MNLKVNTFASEAGSFDFTGSGLESISCLGKSLTKRRQSLVADLSDCVVSGHDFKARVLF